MTTMANLDFVGITGRSGRGSYNSLIFRDKSFNVFGRSAGRSRNQSGIRWELIR